MRVHGGDWNSYQTKYGSLPLDFSQNVSPLGLPEGVKRAAAAALEEADRYPDPRCTELRTALAEKLSVSEEWILFGNGAADLIWRLCLARQPSRVLVTAPGFNEYEAAACRCGAETDHFALKAEEGFRVTEALMNCITPQTGILFLGQPNNPAGVSVGRPLLEKLLDKCEANGTLLVLDECFTELLDDPERHTLLDLLPKTRYLVLLRAFTKSYAMAGLRLGYCLCSDTALLRGIQEAGQPWPVSHVAQQAGIAALREENYLKRLRTLICQQRPMLMQGLSTLGITYITGEANYLLFYCPHIPLQEELCARGILIRNCADLSGLGPGWYRVAVRTAKENERLLVALTEVINTWQNV